MNELSYIIATAGHVDHGKSTLVEALSGINPDRLPEEQKRGMTIELGFAQLSLSDPQRSGVHYSLGLVDVPGHSDFVRNMVAGVGSIDVALLVVACDDGWMPQTEEHLQILLYLGAQRGVVALTKSDAAEDISWNVAEVREKLAGTALESAAVVPVCAITGDGLEELKDALREVLRDTPPQADDQKPWLNIDRAFSPKGAGTVVTGTLCGGRLEAGQELVVQPRGIPTRVRSLQRHGKPLDAALPGMRTAVQLHEVAVHSEQHPEGLRRGDVLTLAELGQPSKLLHVWLQRSSRQPEAPPLRTGQKVWLHVGAASYEARVNLAEGRSMEAGAAGMAELRITTPVLACGGDRFVLRDLGKHYTLAGGLVLDAAPRYGRFRKAPQQALLEARAHEPGSLEVWLRSQMQRDHAVLADQLLRQTRFPAAAVQQAALSCGEVFLLAPWFIHLSWWQQLIQKVSDLVLGFHRSQPQALGMKLGDLRAKVESELPDKRLFDPLLEALGTAGFVRGAGLIRSSSHVAKLPPELQAAGEKLRKALAVNPIEPPNPKELAPTPVDQKALKFLLDTGEAVFLDEKAVLLATAYEGLKRRIAELLREKGKATVAEIREALGTTRRILVPLLERLDKESFTRRSGDFRSLR
jgi:selenocysteine-specific elongation factor